MSKSWYSRSQDIEYKDGHIGKEYHLVFETTDKELARRIEKIFHNIMDGIEPEPQWIPCSERLPEDKQEVLVTEYGETDIGRRFEGRWVDRYGDKMKDVTAWMPLPEPYAERRTDDR